MTVGELVDEILVVDDDPRSRAVVVAALESRHCVREAASAQEAEAMLGAHSVDLVLLDVMMPGTSGYEACRRIKADTASYLPVLLLTALADQDARNTGLECGADDFLTKPIDIRELRLRVAAFLRIRRQDQQIRQQVEALRQLDGMREDLVALFAHDLRNPLGGLLGYLSMMQDGAVGGQADDLRAATDAALRLRDGIEDMLHSRRLEEHDSLELTTVAIDDLIDEAVASSRGAGRLREIGVAVVESSDAVVTVDRKLVHRAIENLVANAVKYAPRKGTVEVRARVEASALTIEVADRGRGVPDALKTAIFAKYGSVEASEGHARRGFGYGLYFVHLVAKAHGGSVAVRDRDGGGSVFVLQLPRSGLRD